MLSDHEKYSRTKSVIADIVSTALPSKNPDLTEVLKEIANPNNDVNAKDDRGRTALHYAAMFGSLEIFNALLDRKDIDVNVACHDLWTPLHYAIQMQCYADDDTRDKIAAALCARKELNANVTNNWGLTPLLMASSNGYRNIVSILTTREGIDPNIPNLGGSTALCVAASKGYVDIVNDLLAIKNIDLDASGSSGRTAMNLAAERGHHEIVKLLVEAADNPNRPRYR